MGALSRRTPTTISSGRSRRTRRVDRRERPRPGDARGRPGTRARRSSAACPRTGSRCSRAGSRRAPTSRGGRRRRRVCHPGGRDADARRRPRRDAPRELTGRGARPMSIVADRRPRARRAAAGSATYGGRYVPEVLIPALDELAAAWARAPRRPGFRDELGDLLARLRRAADAAHARGAAVRGARLRHLAEARGPRAHRRAQDQQRARPGAARASGSGKERIIAETGAGQHGVATATACALLGLPVRRVHGRGGHPPPGAERRADEAARRRGRAGHGRARAR